MQLTQIRETINPPDALELKPLRILVCGGRRYGNITRISRVLDRVLAERGIAVIIHGAASGADMIAGVWADHRGVATEVYRANWENGRRAGPWRNQRMIDEGRPDAVIAFPGGPGTRDMTMRARRARIPVWVILDTGRKERLAWPTN